jgi:uncharacterized protein (DUF2384 family)
MSHEESQRLGKVVQLVDQAVRLEPSQNLVAAAEDVLFALRVALEDAGAEEPLVVMVQAIDQYQKRLCRA